MTSYFAEVSYFMHNKEKTFSPVLIAMLALLLLVASLSVFSKTTLITQQTPSQTASQTSEQTKLAKDKIREVIKSIGLVLVKNNINGEHLRPRGSAVVVRSDGIIATNYHVVKNDQTGDLYAQIFIELNEEGKKSTLYRLKALIINKERDLALLCVIPENDNDSTSVKLPAVDIETNQVQILDDIVIIGYPEKGGTTVTVNTGMIEGKDLLEEWIKTDARLIRGNSGGAAVNANGKLIGIPTKIVVDSQQIDKDGDGFPDTVQSYGAVGFLRPAYLISNMLAQLDKDKTADNSASKPDKETPNDDPKQIAPVVLVTVQGIILASEDSSEPIAGARIGLIPPENDEVTSQNLLSWGGSNAEGSFELNKSVPPGKYCLKVKAFGFEPYTKIIEINEKQEKILVKLIRSKG
jgi:S1-C subfamily serine protease